MGQLIVKEPEQFNDAETQAVLKNYIVKYDEGDGIRQIEFNELNEALVLLDRLTDYGYGSDNTIAFYQQDTHVDNLIKVYHKRQWDYPRNSIYI